MERELVIPLRAVTKGRPRLGRRRKAFTPPKTIEFERAIGEAWATAYEGESPLEGPLGCQITIMSNHIHVHVWELAESHRPKYITGDVDNYVKSILDGLNMVAFADDKQIQHFEVILSKENPCDDHAADPSLDSLKPQLAPTADTP
jgi:Holliday junction resolvase RusA-like endonuclease